MSTKHSIKKLTKTSPSTGALSPDGPDQPRKGQGWLLFIAALILLTVAAFALRIVAEDTSPARMKEVWIPGGEFTMGDEEFPDAKPLHKVRVDGFWMDETEVTNEQFADFVQQTNYVTVAERTPRPEDFPPWARAQLRQPLLAGSPVFNPALCPPGRVCASCNDWWEYRPGASWRHPEGPQSDLRDRARHPVVQIAWEDAAAYARWAGKRLPTEAEWERAARAGVEGKRYYWGDDLCPDGKWMANIWQGTFPIQNTAKDGHAGTAPVKSYAPNAYGLYDMAGNVWEWCADWYRADYYRSSPKNNPQGPESSVDPDGADEPKRVQRGGSFLCSDSYCVRYRAGARGQGEPKTGLSHTGFRCVRSAP